MTLRTSCPNCGVGLNVADQFLGKQIRCGKCAHQFPLLAKESKSVPAAGIVATPPVPAVGPAKVFTTAANWPAKASFPPREIALVPTAPGNVPASPWASIPLLSRLSPQHRTLAIAGAVGLGAFLLVLSIGLAAWSWLSPRTEPTPLAANPPPGNAPNPGSTGKEPTPSGKNEPRPDDRPKPGEDANAEIKPAKNPSQPGNSTPPADIVPVPDAPLKQKVFTVASRGGAIMAPDGQTLIVSVPTQAKLQFLDTWEGKELKSLEVEFQPELLALQDGKLYVGTKGAPTVHIIDLASGKEVGEVKLPGSPLHALACHPKTGYVYATNRDFEVYAIDPERKTGIKTMAQGQLLVVDPVDGKYIYTGIQKPINKVIQVEEGPGQSLKISLAYSGLFATMLKYKVDAQDLICVAINDNAAINGKAMGISHDGKRIAMAGGGGWRPKNDPKANYRVAVFETGNMKNMVGQIDLGAYPSGIAFHPVLNYGAAYRSGYDRTVAVFKDKSLVIKNSVKMKADDSDCTILFGGKGTNVIYIGWAWPHDTNPATIEIFPLPLTDEDRQELGKAYPK